MFYGNKFLNAQPVAESFIVLEFDQNNTTNILNELYDFNTEVGYSVLTEGVKEFFKTAGDKIRAIVEKILTAIKKAITWITGKLIGFIDKLLAKLKKKRNETSSTEKAVAPAQSSSGSSSSSSTSSTNSESKEESISYYKLSPEFGNIVQWMSTTFITDVNKLDDTFDEVMGDIDPDKDSAEKMKECIDNVFNVFNGILDPVDKKLEDALGVFDSEKAYTIIEIKYPEYKKALLDQCIKYIEDVKRDVNTMQSELDKLHKDAITAQENFNKLMTEMDKDMKEIDNGGMGEMSEGERTAYKLAIPVFSKMMSSTASIITKYLSAVVKAESACTTVLSKNAVSMNKIITMAQLSDIERIKASEVKPEGESN